MKTHSRKSDESLRENDGNHDPGKDGKRVISRKSLVNKLNYLNFLDKGIHCNVIRKGGESETTVKLKPMPSFGNYLVCLWPDSLTVDPEKAICRMEEISIPDASAAISIIPEIRRMTSKGLCIRIPERCEVNEISHESNRLFNDMKVRINQNNLSVTADIVELKGNILTVELGSKASEEFFGYDTASKVNIAFVKDGEILFTGKYLIRKQDMLSSRILITLEPESQSISRFPPKKFRSGRQTLKPSPDAVFIHPFNGRHVSMGVRDLSGSGFSVNSGSDESLLLTGMVIKDMKLSFAGAFELSCSAQVVHRGEEPLNGEEGPGKEKTIIYGFALIDMPISDHLKLQSIIHQCEDSHSKVCNSLDPEELWQFFFETGFIYSRKYLSFTENKNSIRDTYTKLYTHSPDIARHFTYQEKGRILGHLSMLRFYENAWLIHHHAALKKSNIKAGLSVLNQVARFSYNSIWLDTCHMKYIFCYFRPENAFPNFFFNGFTEKVADRNVSSTDAFAYSSYRKPSDGSHPLPQNWKIGRCTLLDLEDLRAFYNKKSGGGLLIDALDLSPELKPSGDLENIYQESGLTRKRHLLSLRHNGELAAVILINIADMAINMSDLTSSVSMMVIDEKRVTRDIVNAAFNNVSQFFERKRFPVLIYPKSFADSQSIAYQKTYILWILATRYSDHYFDYLDQVNALGAGKH
jgi:hypothetical protein